MASRYIGRLASSSSRALRRDRHQAASLVSIINGSASSPAAINGPSVYSLPTREISHSLISSESKWLTSSRSQPLMISRGMASSSELPTYQEIGMPSLSPTMTQGNIATWHKKVGDSVAAGDVLCEIETDKATLEMESMEDGFIAKIILPDGAKDIPVGQAIAIIVENEEDIPKFADFQAGAAAPSVAPSAAVAEAPTPTPAKVPPPAPTPAQTPTQAPAPSVATSKVFATPAAKKLAEEKKVDLSLVVGSGPDGRILVADIQEYVPAAPAAPKPAAAVPVYGGDSYVDVPNSQIRKIIAQRLLQSKQTIPHYYLSVDVAMDKVSELRSSLNGFQAKAGGKKLSVNDFVIKAAALALKKVPDVNASWSEEFIRKFKNVDISVAVQTDTGLMVPIVKDADKKGLETISEEVKSLAEKARENKLKPEEFQGGTFAVSNLGMYGVKSFAAIINPPQACILAVGGVESRVVPGSEPGEFEKATFMNVTLSCDHRVIDGAVGAQWLAAFKQYLENPISLLL